jgi:hypothetical protein
MNRNRPTRTFAVSALEVLDERIVPTTGLSITQLPVATQEAFVSNRAGEALGSIFTQYENYEAAGASGTFTSSLSNQIYMSGTSVGVDIQFSGGNYSTLPQYGYVEGYLPISELPTVASNGYASTIKPVDEPVIHTTTPSSTTSSNEALVTSRGGEALGSIFNQFIAYELAGASGNFSSTFANQIYLSGTSVGVTITLDGSNFNTMVSQLESIGMNVTATMSQDGLVEGYLPIGQLPTVLGYASVTGISPVYKPEFR